MAKGRVDGLIALENAVSENEKLAHGRGKRNDLGLTGGHEPLVECLDERVESRG